MEPQGSGGAGQWKRRAVALQKCEDSGNAGHFGCRNARTVATQGSLAAEMRGQLQRSTVILYKCEESRARPLSSPNFPSRKAAIPMLLVDIGVVSMDLS